MMTTCSTMKDLFRLSNGIASRTFTTMIDRQWTGASKWFRVKSPRMHRLDNLWLGRYFYLFSQEKPTRDQALQWLIAVELQNFVLAHELHAHYIAHLSGFPSNTSLVCGKWRLSGMRTVNPQPWRFGGWQRTRREHLAITASSKLDIYFNYIANKGIRSTIVH